MNPDAPRCASCKHWRPTVLDHHDDREADDTPAPRAAAVWGTCHLIGRCGSDGWRSEPPTDVAVKAFTRDASDYWSALHTRPDFGCVLHEPVPHDPQDESTSR